MSMAMQPYVGMDQRFDENLMESYILQLGDSFNIRIVWDRHTALVTGICAVAGGLVGSYAGGRLGAALGAGIGGATGFGISAIPLRELWSTIKDKLQELLYIVFNFLRRLDPIDYINAFEILMASRTSRRELVYTILEFITIKLGRDVLSSITAA